MYKSNEIFPEKTMWAAGKSVILAKKQFLL